MSIDQMRAALCRLYGGAPKWVDRVRKMPDNQVYAIYMRMLEAGGLSKK